MTDDAQGRTRNRRRIALLAAALVVVLAVLLVPPWISISRYKNGITRLISESLGRPVKLSSVELRLLPWPGFVLTDLTVAEDPAYGSEPVLHANTVKASIRFASLWRGHMEISRISVDEASVNLVHVGPGVWNLNSLLRTATAKAGTAAGGAARSTGGFPYLEATNSRVNIKDGAEKLPYSLINTDLSFWQANSGEWRVRLRGQPARTDMTLEMGDTGTVRLEANMRRAASVEQMPVHVDLEWREGQMGQLARLIFGSDPGWRGDITGELQLDGTPEAAQVKSRLRATGVHRAEFAPVDPLDFDANCGFVYHATRRAVEKLVCDSPLGKGVVHLTGEMPGEGGPTQLSLELDRVPMGAGLGILRTVRNGLAADLEAAGTVSGKLAYAQSTAPATVPERANKRVVPKAVAPGPLSGSLTVDGFALSGGGLSKPLQVAKFVIAAQAPSAGFPHQALAGTATLAAGGSAPLTVGIRLAANGYQATVRGQAAVKLARELAHLTSLAEVSVLDDVAGDPITVDLNAQGEWQPGGTVAPEATPADLLTGTVTFKNANWKADYLENDIQIAQATLHLDGGQLRWDPVAFSYGPVKGTATVTFPTSCAAGPCPTQFQVQFGEMDLAAIEAAFLGAQEPNTMLSTLIARIHPEQTPLWPELEGTVKATSLGMGQVKLVLPTAAVVIHSDRAEITALDAGVLGGRVHASGSLKWAGTAKAKPVYAFEGHFDQLSPAAVGKLVGESWTGGSFSADGKLDLTGFTGSELADTAKGTLHFEWRHGGTIAGVPVETEKVSKSNGGVATAHWAAKVPVPTALMRFSDWTGDATIADGKLTLGKNQAASGAVKQTVDATVTFGEPSKVQFAVEKEAGKR